MRKALLVALLLVANAAAWGQSISGNGGGISGNTGGGGGSVTVPTTTLVKTTAPNTFSQVTAIDDIPIGSTTPATVAATSIASSLGLTDTSPATSVGISTTGGLAITGSPPNSNAGAVISYNGTYNFPTTGGAFDPIVFNFNETVTGNSAVIGQHLDVNVTYSGTGTLSGELNGIHPLITTQAGVITTGSIENIETSSFNQGIASSWTSADLLQNNVGTLTTGIGVAIGLTNSIISGSAGSTGLWVAISNKATQLVGGASPPTTTLFIQNLDPLAPIAQLAGITLGSTGATSASTKLFVRGTAVNTTTYPGTTIPATTIEAQFLSVAGANIMVVNDGGSVNVTGALSTGTGAVAGSLIIANGGTGGSLTINVAPLTTSKGVSFPNVTTNGDTVALLAQAQTFSGADIFSNTISMTGLSAGTQVSCLGLSSGNAVVTASCGGGGGSGTVTSIVAGTGLTGGTITTSGTIALDLTAANTWTNTVTVNPAAAATGLALNGGDNSNSTFAILAKSLAGSTVFSVTNLGSASIERTLVVGLTGTNTGTLGLLGTTSGSITISPVSGTIVSNKVAFIPTPSGSTDSFALIGTPSIFTALNTFSAHVAGGGTAPTITAGTATLDAQASDLSGTVTEGTAQAGFTLTFGATYTTVPHCVVSSPSGVALTSYAVTATTLAVVNASASADVFTYVCVK